jgi:acylphosphatase
MTAGQHRQRFVILGDVGAPAFPPWIARHAGKLGLRSRVVSQQATRLELLAEGPVDLLDALALGCSLGPQVVLVDRIERTDATDLL